MVKARVARKRPVGFGGRNFEANSSCDPTIDSILITQGPDCDEFMRLFQCQYDRVSVLTQPFRGSAKLSNGMSIEIEFNPSSISYLSHADESGQSFQFKAEVHSMNIVGEIDCNLIASGSVFKAGFAYNTHERSGRTLVVT